MCVYILSYQRGICHIWFLSHTALSGQEVLLETWYLIDVRWHGVKVGAGRSDLLAEISSAGLKHRSHSTGHSLQVIVLPS